MYSVVLLAAMTTGGQTPAWHHGYACGGCYGSCYGNYGVDSWNCNGGGYGSHHGGYAGGCYGGYAGCTGGCYGGYTGGCYGCYTGGCYTCGGGYGCSGGYPWDWSTVGCNGCWGSYGEAVSPYFPQAPVSPPVTAPMNPTTKPGEVLPPPVKPPETLAPNRGRLVVDLPTDARLYIDDTATKTQSEHRTYQTPALAPGQTYYYDVRVEVQRDGKPVSETRRVLVRAGQEAHADFTDMTTTSTAQAK